MLTYSVNGNKCSFQIDRKNRLTNKIDKCIFELHQEEDFDDSILHFIYRTIENKLKSNLTLHEIALYVFIINKDLTAIESSRYNFKYHNNKEPVTLLRCKKINDKIKIIFSNNYLAEPLLIKSGRSKIDIENYVNRINGEEIFNGTNTNNIFTLIRMENIPCLKYTTSYSVSTKILPAGKFPCVYLLYDTQTKNSLVSIYPLNQDDHFYSLDKVLELENVYNYIKGTNDEIGIQFHKSKMVESIVDVLSELDKCLKQGDKVLEKQLLSNLKKEFIMETELEYSPIFLSEIKNSKMEFIYSLSLYPAQNAVTLMLPYLRNYMVKKGLENSFTFKSKNTIWHFGLSVTNDLAILEKMLADNFGNYDIDQSEFANKYSFINNQDEDDKNTICDVFLFFNTQLQHYEISTEPKPNTVPMTLPNVYRILKENVVNNTLCFKTNFFIGSVLETFKEIEEEIKNNPSRFIKSFERTYGFQSLLNNGPLPQINYGFNVHKNNSPVNYSNAPSPCYLVQIEDELGKKPFLLGVIDKLDFPVNPNDRKKYVRDISHCKNISNYLRNSKSLGLHIDIDIDNLLSIIEEMDKTFPQLTENKCLLPYFINFIYRSGAEKTKGVEEDDLNDEVKELIKVKYNIFFSDSDEIIFSTLPKVVDTKGNVLTKSSLIYVFNGKASDYIENYTISITSNKALDLDIIGELISEIEIKDNYVSYESNFVKYDTIAKMSVIENMSMNDFIKYVS